MVTIRKLGIAWLTACFLAASGAVGSALPAAACRRPSSSCCTRSMAATQTASLLSKWRNTAPCVMPTACASAAVVTSAGLRSAARASAAVTSSAWRSAVGSLGDMGSNVIE